MTDMMSKEEIDEVYAFYLAGDPIALDKKIRRLKNQAKHAVDLEEKIQKVLAMKSRKFVETYENPDYANGWNKALSVTQTILKEGE